MSEGSCISCAQEGCDSTCKDDHWSKVKAHDEGWFFQKDGKSWCPNHTPEWVEEWRNKKGKWPGIPRKE